MVNPINLFGCRVERSFNQTLRRQQDEAYMLSLEADQEKERLRCQELERRESEARQLREVEEAERRRKEVSTLFLGATRLQV